MFYYSIAVVKLAVEWHLRCGWVIYTNSPSISVRNLCESRYSHPSRRPVHATTIIVEQMAHQTSVSRRRIKRRPPLSSFTLKKDIGSRSSNVGWLK